MVSEKRVQFIVLIAVALVAVAALFMVVRYHRRVVEHERESRLAWLSKAEESGDRALSRQLLAALIRDFPDDNELQKHWEIELKNSLLEAKSVSETRATIDRLKTLVMTMQGDLRASDRRRTGFEQRTDNFESRIDVFTDLIHSKLVEQEVNARKAKNENYLFLLLNQPPSESSASRDEINQKLNAAANGVNESDWDGAKQNAAFVLRNDPNQAEAASLWIYSTIERSPDSLGQESELLPVTETLLRLDPANYYALYSSAVIYQNTGNLSLAEDRYRKAMEARPSSREAKLGLITVLIAAQKMSDAQGLAKDLWSTGAKTDEVAKLIWQTMSDEPDTSLLDFLADWGKALPASPWPDLYKGDILARNKELQEAIQSYEDSLQKRWSKTGLTKLAEASFQNGAYQKAAGYYRDLIKTVNPNGQGGGAEFALDARRMVGSDIESKNWADALSDGNEVLQLNPSLIEIRAMVGQVDLNIGEPLKAEKVLEPGTGTIEGMSLVEELFSSYWALKEYDKLKSKCKVILSWPLNEEQRAGILEWQKKVDSIGKKP